LDSVGEDGRYTLVAWRRNRPGFRRGSGQRTEGLLRNEASKEGQNVPRAILRFDCVLVSSGSDNFAFNGTNE